MKNTIVLMIAGLQVDMSQDISFAITKQFKNLGNPTDIINDWSKTVTIPFTANNNKLFGNIYNPDRVIASSSTEEVGLFFDPSKKVDFKLLWNGSLLMDGYMKMTSIEKGKGYNVNLFGGLGKVFSELKKITTNPDAAEDAKYVVKPIDDFYMTRNVVSLSWTNTRNRFKKMPYVNIIGFAPTNSGYNDEFDSKMVLITSSREFVSFTDILKNEKTYEDTIYDVDSLIGDGLLPRQIGDYRSYYLQPYMFVDEMFENLQEKTAELTGYSLALDSEWFKSDNPYYYNSVMLLKKLEHKAQSLNSYVGSGYYISGFNLNYPRWYQDTITAPKLLDVALDPIEGVVQNSTIIALDDSHSLRVKYSLDLSIRMLRAISVGSFNLSLGAALFANVFFVDAADDTNFIKVGEHCMLAFGADGSAWAGDTKHFIKPSDWNYTPATSTTLSHQDVTIALAGDVPLKYYDFKNGLKIKVSLIWVPDATGAVFNTGHIIQDNYVYPYIKSSSIMNYELATSYNRSYDKISFNDMWDNEQNYFEQCLKYTKMFNLIWDVDDIAKRITIKPLYKFFSDDTEIADWTDRVDFDENYKIEPLIYDAKYYKLGYEDSDTGLGENYLKKFGMNYGDKVVSTKYNFDSNTTNLIEGIKTPIVNTATVFAWSNIYDGNVVYTQCKEPLVYLQDNENKSVNGFGLFLFYKGLRYFDDLHRRVCISDDTFEMQASNTYTYSEPSSDAALTATKYPLLDVIYEGQGRKLAYYFDKPKLKYDINADYADTDTIYSTCWESYLNEYTAENNHKLTAYVYLSPADFLSFKFNKMVKIGNLLYVVNKISDFNFGSKTKCEFIHVNNPANYRNTASKQPDVAYAKMLTNNLAATTTSEQLWCLIECNVSNLNKDNVRVIYANSTHGELTVDNVVLWQENQYRIFLSQSGFSGNNDGKIQIVYYNAKQMSDVVLLTANWIINIGEEEPAIKTDKAFFTVDSITVADNKTSMIPIVNSLTNSITDANFEIDKNDLSATLRVKSWTRLSNNPVLTLFIVEQRGFSAPGDSGHFTVRIDGEVAARIPWHIVINESTTKPITITGDKFTDIINDKITDKLVDTVFIDGGSLRGLNTKNELVTTSQQEIETGSLLDFGNRRFLLSYNGDEIDDITVNTYDILLYKAPYHIPEDGTGAPIRVPLIGDNIDFSRYELARVVIDE